MSHTSFPVVQFIVRQYSVLPSPQVCSSSLASPAALQEHASSHRSAGCLYCCYCGLASPSLVALTLHQLVWEAPPPAPLPCPLQCGAPALSLPDLTAHLSSSHGAPPGSEGAVMREGRLAEGGVACRRCGTQVAGRVIEEHTVLHCYSR